MVAHHHPRNVTNHFLGGLVQLLITTVNDQSKEHYSDLEKQYFGKHCRICLLLIVLQLCILSYQTVSAYFTNISSSTPKLNTFPSTSLCAQTFPFHPGVQSFPKVILSRLPSLLITSSYTPLVSQLLSHHPNSALHSFL